MKKVIKISNVTFCISNCELAAVWCSPTANRLGGVEMGSGVMGKLAVHGWCMGVGALVAGKIGQFN